MPHPEGFELEQESTGSVDLDSSPTAAQGALSTRLSSQGGSWSSAWFNDLSSPLLEVKTWASGLSQTISDGVAAFAEEFTTWGSTASSGDHFNSAATPADSEREAEQDSQGHKASSRQRLSPSSSSVRLSHGACVHDYFQPQMDVAGLDNPKKDQ